MYPKPDVFLQTAVIISTSEIRALNKDFSENEVDKSVSVCINFCINVTMLDMNKAGSNV